MKTTIVMKTTVCLAALLLGACGGGSGSPASGAGGSGGDVGSGGSNDGSGGKEGNGDPNAPSVDLEVDVQAPGLPTTATANVEGEASFAWSLTGQPEESSLEDADLTDPDEATVTFHPQVSGDYELTVTVTVDGESVEEAVELTVQGYDVPFSVMNVTPVEGQDNATHVAMMVDSGAGEAREVGCPHTVLAATADGAGSVFNRGVGTASYLPRALGDDAQIVSRVFSDDAEANEKVEIAHSGTSCADAEGAPLLVDLGAVVADAAFPMRLSPDGSRLMTIGDIEGTKALLSVGTDGTDQRTLLSGEPEWAPHHAWAGNTEILLVHQDTEAEGTPYQLLRMPDAEDALGDAAVVLDCTGLEAANSVLPMRQAHLTEDYLVLVSGLSLLRLEPDEEGNFDCALDSERTVVLAELAGSADVSDDGERVVYESSDQTGIFVVSVTDPEEPARISPQDGTSHFHPRFGLGGAQVVWTSRYEYQEPEGMGGAPPFDENVVRVYRANADGSHPYVIWQSGAPQEETVYATGGSNRGTTCSFGLPLGAGSSGFVAMVLGGLTFLRRRRRAGGASQSR